MSIDLAQFHRTFFEECFEGIDLMERDLLRMGGGPGGETVNAVFRAAHSIKGGAATFGFAAIASFTHHMETLLDQMRSGTRAISDPAVDLLLRATDALRSLLAAARDGEPLDTARVAGAQAALEAFLGAADAPESTAVAVPAVEQAYLIRFVPAPDLFRSGNDPLLILRELATLGTLETRLDLDTAPAFAECDAESCHMAWSLRLLSSHSRAELQEVFAWVEGSCELDIRLESAAAPPAAVATTGPAVHAVAAPTPRPGEHTVGDGGSIRVGTDKIDALMNLVGELIITQAMLAQLAGALDPVLNEKLLAGLSQLDRNTRLLQEAVMSTRMLPIDSVFSRFPRLVRDLAAKLGKQVRLTTVGESTELDKSVIEKISDPLNHLVRNSLDHGIESPEARSAAGKDAVGTVTLKAAHQGDNILVEVCDDGRGLDRARILAKAREQGIACTDAMSDAEVWQLIFAPGFSTADRVTDVSGRGVGMDVVKKNIAALGGSVELHSSAGRGSRTVIRLPLTLAILDGMSVGVSGEIFILPLSAVIESLQPQAEQVKRVVHQGTVVRVRNEYLPLVDLRQWFGLSGKSRPLHEAIAVIVESEGRKLALQVDELVGQQQVVIKSLEANYRRIRGVSGATILGDGRVSLILDVGAIVRLFSQAQAA
ncbi:chemotaxis protein CheA [Nevskia soli]|uniref:chemotaxis protein CheA n=1 Tax=Nevskia soli TaxID=418856 RepID=UPI0004A72FF9|nr:chemotaxis protein CheA [Nevskia soli]